MCFYYSTECLIKQTKKNPSLDVDSINLSTNTKDYELNLNNDYVDIDID